MGFVNNILKSRNNVLMVWTLIISIMCTFVMPLIFSSNTYAYAETNPTVFYVTNTSVKPGDMILVKGENLRNISKVKICMLNNEPVDSADPLFVKEPNPDSLITTDNNPRCVEPEINDTAVELNVIQASQQSFKIVIPSNFKIGVYVVKPIDPSVDIRPFYINYPGAEWAQGDQGTIATPGGWLRVTGKNMSIEGGKTQIVLESVSSKELTHLDVEQVYDSYSVGAKIPSDIALDDYNVYVHNGFGGSTAWSEPVSLKIAQKEVWPQKTFNVKSYGAVGDGIVNDTAAVRDALYDAKNAGGGIVYFPRGRYHLTNNLEVPKYTVLRGESRELTQVFWSPFEWDYLECPDALIKGTDHFALEEITFCTSRSNSFVIGDTTTSASGNISINRVILYSNAGMGPDMDSSTAKLKSALDEAKAKGPAMLRFGGPNIQIKDSIISGTGMPVQLSNAKRALVKGNTLSVNYYGWSNIAAADGIIFEDNDLSRSGFGFGSTYTPTQRLYVARNTISDLVTNTREAMTYDGGSGGYWGPVASINGTQIVLPDGGKASSMLPEQWIQGGVFILSGKGAGQYRRIVHNTKDTIEIDQPFAVDPDNTSKISVTTIRETCYYVGNTMENTGAFQFYGVSSNTVVDGNTMIRSQGMNSWGKYVYSGYQANWYNDFVNNELTEGNYFHYYGIDDLWSGMCSLKVTSQGNDTLNIGTLLRGNKLSNNCYIAIDSGTPADSLVDLIVDNNTVDMSLKGIEVKNNSTTMNRTILYRNKFTNVDTPLIIPAAALSSGKVLVKELTDTVAPETEVSINGQKGNNEWYLSDVSVNMSPVDNVEGSGVAKTEYSIKVNKSTEKTNIESTKGFVPYTAPIQLKEGSYTLSCRSIDVSGNIETVKTFEINVDTTSPSFAVTCNDSELTNGLEYTDATPVAIKLASDDKISGIDVNSITVDGKNYTSGSELNFAGSPEQHTVQLMITDLAGNKVDMAYTINIITSIQSMKDIMAKNITEKGHGESQVKELYNKLDEAQTQLDNGNKKNAAKAMEEFLKQLNKETGHDNDHSNNDIPEAVRIILDTDAKYLIGIWSAK